MTLIETTLMNVLRSNEELRKENAALRHQLRIFEERYKREEEREAERQAGRPPQICNTPFSGLWCDQPAGHAGPHSANGPAYGKPAGPPITLRAWLPKNNIAGDARPCNATINGKQCPGTVRRTGPGITPGSNGTYACDTHLGAAVVWKCGQCGKINAGHISSKCECGHGGGAILEGIQTAQPAAAPPPETIEFFVCRCPPELRNGYNMKFHRVPIDCVPAPAAAPPPDPLLCEYCGKKGLELYDAPSHWSECPNSPTGRHFGGPQFKTAAAAPPVCSYCGKPESIHYPGMFNRPFDETQVHARPAGPAYDLSIYHEGKEEPPC